MEEAAQVPQQQEVVGGDSVVNWSASEYINHEKTMLWYMVLAAATIIAGVLLYVLNRDIVMIAVLLTVAISFGFFAGRKPVTKSYVLSGAKLTIDQKSYPLDSFKSFSVVEEGAISSIWLRSFRRFSPTLVIYCSLQDEPKIAALLSEYLPFEQHELDAIDRLSKRLRF